jgi:hypothetical protein
MKKFSQKKDSHCATCQPESFLITTYSLVTKYALYSVTPAFSTNTPNTQSPFSIIK